jgi:chromosome segregation ATPase
MVNSSFSGGSFRNSSVGNNFDAAASERERIKAATEARLKNERERANMKISELQRKLERNQQEIKSKESELHRISQEIFHAGSDIKMVESTLAVFDNRAGESKIRVKNFETQLAEKQKEAVEERKEMDEKKREEVKVEAQLAELQRKLAQLQRDVIQAEQRIREIDLDTRHLEGSMHKNAGDGEHTLGEKAYKEKEIENKKKALSALEQKKKIDTDIVNQLTLEDKKIEAEIQKLKSTIK